jgi:hypothetical protein
MMAVVLGLLAEACSSTSTPSTPGALPVTVTSVTGTLTPYNPAISSAGIPAEEVAFTVGGAPPGLFVCQIHVRFSGHTVGSTSISAAPPAGNPPTVQESVAVAISRATFAGTPANALVTCRTSGVPGSTTTAISAPTTTTASSTGTAPVPTSAAGEPPPQTSPAQTQIKSNPFGPVCVVTVRPGSSENAPKAPTALPSQPVAVDAVRIPGLNDPLCQSGVVTASEEVAGQLVDDMNAAQTIPPGQSFNCPADDGHGIDLVFRYAKPSEAIVVWVDLSGCRTINGLATGKWTSEAVTADLQRFVPPAWF